MKFSLPTVLVLIFMVLKLTHNIAWSWWWVFAPWWLGIPAIFVILLLCAVVVALAKNR